MVKMEKFLNKTVKELLPEIQKRIMQESTYFGIKTLKSPMDFWVYQEIIYNIRPDVIVEVGNFRGGSTLALAHFLDSIGNGKIIGIDINHSEVPDIVKNHKRITLITGDACEMFQMVAEKIQEGSKVIIIEDSSHTFQNTLDVLKTYNSLVSVDSYFIVEDGICHHGLEVGPNPGPYEAVEEFIRENKSFKVDEQKESFLITWNPKGYLKRVK